VYRPIWILSERLILIKRYNYQMDVVLNIVPLASLYTKKANIDVCVGIDRKVDGKRFELPHDIVNMLETLTKNCATQNGPRCKNND